MKIKLEFGYAAAAATAAAAAASPSRCNSGGLELIMKGGLKAHNVRGLGFCCYKFRGLGFRCYWFLVVRPQSLQCKLHHRPMSLVGCGFEP